MTTHVQLVNQYRTMFEWCLKNDCRSKAELRNDAKWARSMSSAFGCVILGSGYSGAAFATKEFDDLVIKIGMGKDDGSAAYLTYCYTRQLSGQGATWMPVIYSMYVDPITGFYVCLMERLKHLSAYTDQYIELLKNYKNAKGISDRWGCTTRPMHKGLRGMVDTLGPISDLHTDNCMMRGHQVVLTDPYFAFNQNSIYNPYRLGSARFINEAYEQEVRLLQDACLKPEIERIKEIGLPRLRPGTFGVIKQPEQMLQPALLRMRNDRDNFEERERRAKALELEDLARQVRELANVGPRGFMFSKPDFPLAKPKSRVASVARKESVSKPRACEDVQVQGLKRGYAFASRGNWWDRGAARKRLQRHKEGA